MLNRKLFIGKDNFDQNYVYVVHRPLGKYFDNYGASQERFLDYDSQQNILWAITIQ